MNPITLHTSLTTEFKALGCKHAREFSKVLSRVVTEARYSDDNKIKEEDLDSLLAYFSVCVKGKSNLGCNQALKMVSSAYKRIFNIVVWL